MTILFKKRMTCWIYPSKNKQLIEHQRLLTTKSLGWDRLCTHVLICPQNMASVHRGVRNTPIHSRGCSSTSPRRNNSCRAAPYWMATYPCFSHLTSTTSTTPHSMVKAPISPALAITNIGSKPRHLVRISDQPYPLLSGCQTIPEQIKRPKALPDTSITLELIRD